MVRLPLAETPYVTPVAQQVFSVVYCRIVLVVYPGLGHLRICVSGVAFDYRVSGIDNNPELLFLNDQTQERDHDARDEVHE
jgi:hypothetical protein